MGKVKIVQNGAMFEISDDLRFIRVNKTGSDHVKLGPRAGNNPSTRFYKSVYMRLSSSLSKPIVSSRQIIRRSILDYKWEGHGVGSGF